MASFCCDDDGAAAFLGDVDGRNRAQRLATTWEEDEDRGRR